MKITIFWTGYVGLVTWTCLAEMGHEVLCIDIDQKKIDNLEKGIIPIYEPGLEELVEKNFAAGKLSFSTNAKKWATFWKAIFNAVGTPPDKKNHNKADLQFVREVAKTIWKNINEYTLFINKSTVPVWTGKECRNIIKKEIYSRKKNIDFDVASNPEFLREWSALYDFMNPDRIVCWVQNEKSKNIMREIYASLTNKTQILFTDIKSAEIIKYASNSFLATKISFINEIANFSKKVWWNIKDISQWIGADSRIGNDFLESWIGYGWSCFPKDIKAFIETWKDYDFDFKIIKQTEEVNEKQKVIAVEKLLEIEKNLKDKTIAIWWLSFKPNTDDIRDASSISVIKKLLDLEVKKIQAFDPISIENTKALFKKEKKLKFVENRYDTLIGADILMILTEWNEFKVPNLKLMRKNMKWNIIIDGRNIWKKKQLEADGFIYKSI